MVTAGLIDLAKIMDNPINVRAFFALDVGGVCTSAGVSAVAGHRL